ncbi:MAG: hypothetical protein ACF8QF_01925 [Phycisphaerales bacterium]
MERRIVVWVVACACTLVGCAGSEREAALLAQTVETGIDRLHGQQARVIGALGDVERAAVNDEWASMYERAEAGYREREGLGVGDALSAQQRMEVAALAAAAREDLLASIEAKEADLLAQSRASVDAVRAMQGELTLYLQSRADAGEVRRRMLAWLGVLEEETKR